MAARSSSSRFSRVAASKPPSPRVALFAREARRVRVSRSGDAAALVEPCTGPRAPSRGRSIELGQHRLELRTEGVDLFFARELPRLDVGDLRNLRLGFRARVGNHGQSFRAARAVPGATRGIAGRVDRMGIVQWSCQSTSSNESKALVVSWTTSPAAHWCKPLREVRPFSLPEARSRARIPSFSRMTLPPATRMPQQLRPPKPAIPPLAPLPLTPSGACVCSTA